MKFGKRSRGREDHANNPGTLATRARAGRRGQSLAEFAIGLPCMLLLLLGTLDVGQLFFEYIELRNAVREGAAYAARTPYDTDGIADAVRRHADSLATGTTVTVSNIPADIDPYDQVTITVEAERIFQPLTTSFFARFGIGPITLNASSTARVHT